MFKPGDIVTARPSGWNEELTDDQSWDREPFEGSTKPRTGVLEIVKSRSDLPFNLPSFTVYLVDGHPVDPDTIEVVKQPKKVEAAMSDNVFRQLQVAQLVRRVNRVVEFYNKCHDPATGRFDDCESTPVGDRLASAKPQGAAGKDFRPGDGPRMGLELIPEANIKKVIARQSEVPGFEHLKGRTDRDAIDEIVKQQSDNIFDYADFVMEHGRPRAEATADWYPWANSYMRGIAEANGLSEHGTIAAAAALSASAPWESNVPWAKYLAENLATNKGPDGGRNQKVDAKWAVAAYLNETAGGHAPNAERISGLIGKRLHELSDEDVALMMRGKHDTSGEWDPAKGKFSKGEVKQLGEEVHAGLGTAGAGTIPQSIANMAKAVSVLRDPSESTIDAAIGNQNKVRSFYQNMRDPRDKEFADVTVDTHHFGIANGLPWTTDSVFVKSGGKNVTQSPDNAQFGALGTYPIVVEATRQAAARINEKYGTNFTPNQIQSIVWEHHKAFFPPKIRGATVGSGKNRRPNPMLPKIDAARSAYALYLRTGGREGISKSEMLARINGARTEQGGPTVEELIKRYAKG